MIHSLKFRPDVNCAIPGLSRLPILFNTRHASSLFNFCVYSKDIYRGYVSISLILVETGESVVIPIFYVLPCIWPWVQLEGFIVFFVVLWGIIMAYKTSLNIAMLLYLIFVSMFVRVYSYLFMFGLYICGV